MLAVLKCMRHACRKQDDDEVDEAIDMQIEYSSAFSGAAFKSKDRL